MVKAYIAGKVSGLDKQEVIAKFKAKEMVLKELGYEVKNPMSIADWDKDWQWNMKRAVELMMQADEIHLLPCWLESTGAREEERLARLVGMSVVYPDNRRK